MQTGELKRILRERGGVLFGAGYVAGLFLSALEESSLPGRIRCCFVSGRPAGPPLRGIPVFAWDRETVRAACGAGRPAPLLCIAVHEAALETVRQTIGDGWPGPCAWIYPNLFELAFGPFGETRTLAAEEILSGFSPEDGWLAARYAAAGPALAGDLSDAPETSLYLKAQAAFAGAETARLRLAACRRLAESFAGRGFDPAHPILLDGRGRVIDGLHRLALALRCGAARVPCRAAGGSALYEAFFDERVRFTARVRAGCGLTEEEERAFARAQRALFGAEI